MSTPEGLAVTVAREIMREEWQLTAAARTALANREELAADLALVRAAIARLTDCAHAMQRRLAGIGTGP